jgi:hypothetical protein
MSIPLKHFDILDIFDSYSTKTNIEKFINLKAWAFPNSVNWYKVVKNGYSIKMSDTGITLPNNQYSISFMYNLTGLNSEYNNVFHVSNTGNNCCNDGDRQPGLWVKPNETRFYLRFSTDPKGNDGFDSIDAVALNNKVLITLIFDKNIVTMYINTAKLTSQTFNNIHQIKPGSTLFIGDPWHNNNGTINIRNFTIYDGILTSDQIAEIYNTNLRSWTFPNSRDWYKVVKNGYNIKMSDTGITLPSRQHSISFMYNLTGLNSQSNNIFHISNNGKDCCNDGDRALALWVKPNDTRFYLRFSTDPKGDDGFDAIDAVALNNKVLVTFIVDNNTVTMYLDAVKKVTQTFSNIHPINPTATLYIGSPWYENNGINIRGFTIYDGILTNSQIKNIYDTNVSEDAKKAQEDARKAQEDARKAAAEAIAKAETEARAAADAISNAEARARADEDARVSAQAKLKGINTDIDSNTLKSNKITSGIKSIDRYLDPSCKPNEYIYCVDGQIQCNDILGGNLNKLQSMSPYVSGNTLAGCDSYINKVNITDYTIQNDLNIGTGVYFDLSNCPSAKPWRVGNKIVPYQGCYSAQSEAVNVWNTYIDISLNSKVTYLLNDEVFILSSFLKSQTIAGLPQILAILDAGKETTSPYTTLNGQKYYYGKLTGINNSTYTVTVNTSKLSGTPLTSISVPNVPKNALLKNSLYNPKTNDYYNNLKTGSYPRPTCKSGSFTSCLSSPPFTMYNGMYVPINDPTFSVDASYNERTQRQTQFDSNTPFSSPPVNPSGILDNSKLLEFNYLTSNTGESPFIKCIADHGSNVGDPLCCNQTGKVTDTKYICPQEVPICSGYSKDDNAYGYCS